MKGISKYTSLFSLLLTLSGCTSKNLFNDIKVDEVKFLRQDPNHIIFFASDTTQNTLLMFSDFGIEGPDGKLESFIYISPDTTYRIEQGSPYFDQCQQFYNQIYSGYFNNRV